MFEAVTDHTPAKKTVGVELSTAREEIRRIFLQHLRKVKAWEIFTF
jgi:hypothetical protein